MRSVFASVAPDIWAMATLPSRPKSVAALVRSVPARIVVVRGARVMLDSDLAELYGVTTKALNRAVSRNRAAFRRISPCD